MDLPEKGASEDQLEILSGGVLMLRDAYPNMFKESQKMMRPHLNVDFLRNELYQVMLHRKCSFHCGHEQHHDELRIPITVTNSPSRDTLDSPHDMHHLS